MHINKHVSMVASADGAFLVVKICAGESGSSGADTETKHWLQHLTCWCFSLAIKASWCSFPLQRGCSPRGNLRPLSVLMQMHPWGISEGGHSARLTASLRFVFSPQEIAAWVLSVRTRNQIKKLSCWYRHAHFMTFQWVNDLGTKQTKRVTCGKCLARWGTNFWL